MKHSKSSQTISLDEIDSFAEQREKIDINNPYSKGFNNDSSDEEFDEGVLNLPSSDEEEEEEKVNESWGKSKKSFYSGDIGASDLQEESKEAKKIQSKLLSEMKDEDFNKKNSSVKKTGTVLFDLFSDIPDSQEGFSTSGTKFLDKYSKDSELETLTSKGLSKAIPKDKDLEELLKIAPELLVLVQDFNSKFEELKEKIEPTIKKLSLSSNPTNSSQKGLSFLRTKNQLLVGYCANLSFLLSLKVGGVSIEGHPVLKRLVKYRVLLEKIKPMEKKLQYFIDKLLNTSMVDKKISTKITSDSSLSFKPNLDLLEINNDAAYSDDGSDSNPLYKAKKIAPVHFNKTGNDDDLKGSNISSKSRLLADIQADYDDNPEEESIDPAYRSNKALERSNRQRDNYEEDNFVRFTLSAKEQRKANKLQGKPIDELEDLNDFFKQTSPSSKASTSSTVTSNTTAAKLTKRGDESTNIERFDDSDLSEIEDDGIDGEEMDIYKNAGKKHRKMDDNGMDNGKVQHQYRPINNLPAGAKRNASYEMMKNKGLTPHRSKEVRNPRVKHRMNWERAQKKIKSFKSIKEDSKKPYGGESTGIRTGISKSVKFQK